MPGPRKLTLKIVEALAPAPRCPETRRVKSYAVRDTLVPGLMCIVHEQSRVFAVQRDVYHPTDRDPKNPTRRLKVGTRRLNLGDTKQFQTVDEVRERAREAIATWASGADPRRVAAAPSPKAGATFEACWLRYRERCERKELSAGTIKGYDELYRRYLSDWAKLPMADVANDADAVYQRHVDVTTNHGPYVANQVMRLLRAIHNHVAKRDRALPPNPVNAVDFNKEHRRDGVVADLGAWWREVQAMPNPVRRDWHVFVLLTGMRKTAACVARVEDLNLDAGFLHVPNPKGGRRKAFDLPLSDHVVAMLRKRVEENHDLLGDDNPWLFPSLVNDGERVTEPEHRDMPSPHVLRHTFATLAAAAGVPELDIKLLLNHALPGVTGGYIHQTALGARLRDMTNKVTAHVLEKCAAKDHPQTPSHAL